MFIPARSHRMKASVKQRFLQSLSDRTLSIIENFQRINSHEIAGLRPTGVGSLGALILALVTLIIQLPSVSDTQSLMVMRERMIVIGGMLLIWHYYQHTRGKIEAKPSPYEHSQQASAHEVHALRQALQWQQELASLADCMSLDELQRRATSQHMVITGATEALGENTHHVHECQSNALQMLSTLVALRRTAIESRAWREQQRMALDALWQVAGLLHIPGSAHNNLLHEPCARLAVALDLDWLVVLAPGSHAPIAPVLTIFGRAKPGATLNTTQLRMATEALYTEQPLVRAEGNAGALACLPVVRVGHAPMVIVARGAAAEEATQSILLLLGDLLAQHYEQCYEYGA